MATNVWEGNDGTKNWSSAGDWSLAHVPQAGEDVVIDGTGSALCNLNEATAALLSLTISAVGFIGNSWTITVAGSVVVTGGTNDFGTSTLTLTASGNLSNPTAASTFYHVILAPASGTTTLTGDIYTRTLELGDGVLTQSSTAFDAFIGTGLTVGGDLKVVTATASSMIDNSGGGDDLDFIFGMTSGSYTMDGFDGDLALDLAPATACGATIKVVTRAIEAERLDMSASTCTFDFNGQDGTIAAVDSGTANASSILCGEGTLDFGVWVSDNADGTIGLEGATIQMGGQFSMRTAGMTITNGTSTVNFDDGSGTNAIELQGESLDTVNITGAATWELQDAFACASFSMTAGSFDDGGFACTVAGLVSINTSGTFTATGSLTQTGDANFTYADNGTYSVNTQDIDLQGTGSVSLAKLNLRPASFTCAASGKVTTIATMGGASGWSGTLTLGTGTFTLNALMTWVGTGAENIPIATGGATINGTGTLNFLSYHAGLITITFPNLTIAGSVNFQMAKVSGDGVCTVNLGTLSAPNIRVYNGRDLATAGVVLNTNGNALTAGADFACGSNSANGPFTLNAGASVISAGSFGNTVYNGAGGSTLNMGTSAWTVGGSWTTQTNHTISVSAWSLDLDGSGTQDVTSAGEPLATVDITGSGVVEIQDDFTCTDFTLTTGTFDTNSVGDHAMTVTSLDMNGGNFNANGSAIGVGGNCTIDGGSADFGTSTVTLTASGNLVNGTLNNSFYQLTQGDSIVTTLTNLVYVDNLTCGDGSTIQSDGSDRDLRVQDSLVVNTVTWSSNGADLKLWYEKDNTSTFPGDDYGDVSLHFRRDGSTLTFDGDVTTTALVRGFSKTNNATGTMASGGYDLTCGELQMGVSGVTNRGVRLLMEGTSTVTVNGNCTVYADNGTANNRIAWASGNTGTSVITGNLVVQSGGELDWIAICTHTLQAGGDVTFDAAAVIDEGAGTIELNGSGAQAVDFGSQALNDVAVTNTGGTVSFTTAPDIQGTFKPGNGGSTVTIRQPTTGTTHWEAIDTSAATGTGTIDINSIGESASWALTIGSNQTVTSVDVTYSSLTGFTMDATDATNVDGGNNSVNWNFGAPPAGNVPQKMNSYRRRRT